MKSIFLVFSLILFSTYIYAQPAWSAYGGIPNAATRNSVIDASGIKWVAMFGGGISKFKLDETYDNFNSSNSGIPENFATCITTDNLENKWIGTNNSGVTVYNGTTWTTYNTSSGLPGNQINCITVDASNNKWIGVNLNGLVKYDGSAFTNYNSGNSSLPNNNVNCITIDASGNKWIGTYGGLAKFNGTTWSIYNTGNCGIAHDQVYSVTIESPTIIWIGTAGGLCKFDGTTGWTTYTSGNSGLPYNYVNCVTIDQNNIKWIGTTQGGMAEFDGASSWTVYNTSNSDIPGLDIRNIVIDNDNNLWVCSNGGGFAFYGEIPIVDPTDATLSNLKVNGTTVSGFNSSTYTYNVVLPYGSALPVVTATTNVSSATAVITNVTSLPGIATVLVTSQDGTTNHTYTINFTVAAPSSDASLSSLLVNGVSVPGFSPTVYTYNVTYPYGTTALPVVTATTNFAGATKVITNITAFPGTATVAVTAQNGTTTQTYSIYFSVTPASTVATLSSLLVNGTSVPSFSPSTYTYNVVLPYGSSIPTITATTTDVNATKVINNISSFPGTATVVVTAQDGSNTLTYNINLSLTPNTDATLSSLLVNSVSVPSFSPTTYVYNIELPFGTTVTPTVTASSTDSNADIVITNATGLPGTTSILVTAEDGTTTLTYTIHFTVATSIHAATISEFSLFPNPSKGIFSVNCDYPSHIIITDISGKTILTQDIDVNNKIINLTNHKPGVYFIQIENQKGSSNLKLIYH